MMVDSFFKKGLFWKQCYSVCCDGGAAMLGMNHGFTAQVKQENASVMIVHCLLHHENLASRKLSHELKKVISDVLILKYQYRWYRPIFMVLASSISIG